MKPFLGIDITTNRKNERLNGNEFLILKPSEILSQTLAKTTEQKDVIIQKSKMPLLLRIIKSHMSLSRFYLRQRPIESTGFPCRSISQRTLDFLASSYLRYSIRPINNL